MSPFGSPMIYHYDGANEWPYYGLNKGNKLKNVIKKLSTLMLTVAFGLSLSIILPVNEAQADATSVGAAVAAEEEMDNTRSYPNIHC